MNSKKIELTVYDFDGTMYNGDSFIDFWKFMLRKKPWLIIIAPYWFFRTMLHVFRFISDLQLKSSFLMVIDNVSISAVQAFVKEFWETHENKINPWVYDALQKDQEKKRVIICISASPSFLLNPIAEKLNLDALIATDFLVLKNRQYNKPVTLNCKSEEKINRLNEWAEIKKVSYSIKDFYSDSKADIPLYRISEMRYFVKNGIVSEKPLFDIT